MRHLMGLVLACGFLAATAGESKAQFSLSIGNPYYGQGIAIGTPGYAYGYNSGYSGFAAPGYPGYYSGYNGYSTSAYVAGPGTFSYSSGYRGYAPPVVGYGYPVRAIPYGYVNRPYYGNYGYGVRNGFRPFRGVNSWLR
jgi:hypothetical protein